MSIPFTTTPHATERATTVVAATVADRRTDPVGAPAGIGKSPSFGRDRHGGAPQQLRDDYEPRMPDRPDHAQRSAAAMRIHPTEGHAVLQFALKWIGFGGGQRDEIFETFGCSENQYFTQLQDLLRANELDVGEPTRRHLMSICSRRIQRRGGHPGRQPVAFHRTDDPDLAFRGPRSAQMRSAAYDNPLTLTDLLVVLEALTGISHRTPEDELPSVDH